MKKYVSRLVIECVVLADSEEKAESWLIDVVDTLMSNDDLFSGLETEEVTSGHDLWEWPAENEGFVSEEDLCEVYGEDCDDRS